MAGTDTRKREIRSMYEKKPWLKFYGDIPESIDYPRVTMYEAAMKTVERLPGAVAYDFLGYTASYRQFGSEIDRCADALASLGMKKGARSLTLPDTTLRDPSARRSTRASTRGRSASWRS